MPENRLSKQYKVWKVVNSFFFEWFIMSMILLNTVILMMNVSEMSSQTLNEHCIAAL